MCPICNMSRTQLGASVKSIKEISIYDTIHDFKQLKDNVYYTTYIQSELDNLKLPLLPASQVEDALTAKNHFDTDFYVDYKQKQLSVAQQFYTRVSDLDDDHFKTWMGTIILLNTKTIDFITDTTLLSYDTGCSIHVQHRKGRFITNSSTVYDRGNKVAAVETKPDCVHMEHSDVVELTKLQGHLFEIDTIKVADNYVVYRIPGHAKDIRIDLMKYVERDSNDLFKLSLYKAVISCLKTSGKTTANLHKLLDLLQARYNIPDVLIRRVRDRNEDARIQLTRMLFDFKRAGDHLQVKSCAGKPRVFISNDRMSILLSAMSGIPTIRTTKDVNHNRVLYFYNLKLTNAKEFERMLMDNMKGTILECNKQLVAFKKEHARLYADLKAHYSWLTEMVNSYSFLISTTIVHSDMRNRPRRQEARYIWEYECYHRWVVAYYFFSFLKFLVDTDIDSIIIRDVHSHLTKDALGHILDEIIVNKYYDIMDLRAITSVQHMIAELKQFQTNAEVKDIRFWTEFAVNIMKKPYINLIVGMEHVNAMFNELWENKSRTIQVNAIIQDGIAGTLKTRTECVTPTVAAHVTNVQALLTKTLAIKAVGNNIPVRFASEVEAVEFNEDAITHPEEPLTRVSKRRRLEGGTGPTLASRQIRKDTGYTIASRVQASATPNRDLSHFKSRLNTRVVSPQSRLTMRDTSTRPSPQGFITKETAYADDSYFTDRLIEVIITFFIKTVPSLSDMIVRGEAV